MFFDECICLKIIIGVSILLNDISKIKKQQCHSKKWMELKPIIIGIHLLLIKAYLDVSKNISIKICSNRDDLLESY